VRLSTRKPYSILRDALQPAEPWRVVPQCPAVSFHRQAAGRRQAAPHLAAAIHSPRLDGAADRVEVPEVNATGTLLHALRRAAETGRWHWQPWPAL
jgi:hypothetical protein